MDPQRRQDRSVPERKGQKRKLEEELVIGDEQLQQQQQQQQREISSSSAGTSLSDTRQALLSEVSSQVNVLNVTFSWIEANRAAAKRAAHVLAELAKNEEVVNWIVEGDAVPALVKHLQAPPTTEADRNSKPFEHEVEKGSAFALGLLAVKVILVIFVFIVYAWLTLAWSTV